jgi:hypothetical protein
VRNYSDTGRLSLADDKAPAEKVRFFWVGSHSSQFMTRPASWCAFCRSVWAIMR